MLCIMALLILTIVLVSLQLKTNNKLLKYGVVFGLLILWIKIRFKPRNRCRQSFGREASWIKTS